MDCAQTPPSDAIADDPWQRLRHELGQFEPPYPAETVRWARGQQTALTPHFLELLERVAQDPQAAASEDIDLFCWAFVFLATWRDQRAWAPMLALLQHPAEQVDEVLGDMLLECYGRALASVCPGDVAPLRERLLDESLSVWIRIALLDAWRLRVLLADAPRDEFEGVLLQLGERSAETLRRLAEGKDRPEDVEELGADVLLPHVVSEAGRLQSQRLQPAVCGWFDEGLVDPMSIGREDYDRAMEVGEVLPDGSGLNRHSGLIEDPELETRWWGCWQKKSYEAALMSKPLSMSPPLPQLFEPAPTTYIRPDPKVGRNDPCPCGSGKKYKKCHGAG